MAKEFLTINANTKENEILYAVKATAASDGTVMALGIYCGAEINPLKFLVNSKKRSENVYLKQVTLSEAIIEYFLSNKDEDINYNIYLFKVLYKDFKLCKIESFHGGENDLEFYIFDKKSGIHGEVLKRFGKVKYAPSLSFSSSKA